MKLRDVIKQINRDEIEIIFRTYIDLPDEGETDIFAGICTYKDGELISGDLDTYSLDDEVLPNWEYVLSVDESTLCVWYESKWIRG